MNNSKEQVQAGYSPRHLTEGKRRARPGRKERGRHLLLPIIIQLVTFFGLAALLYPTAANWFSAKTHNTAVSGYVKSVSEENELGLESVLEAANDYNKKIPAGMLRDPFANNSHASDEARDLDFQDYMATMATTDRGVMGEIIYPRLKVDLPIYHDTTDEILNSGAGHLYGSSLPVGGVSTHSILTSHSGKVHSKLFTPLLEAETGDIFKIKTLGETLYYKVFDVKVVLPEETSSLKVLPGEDLVTLVTCAPLGVNSHRMLVTGERIETPTQQDVMYVLDSDHQGAGFPWWAVAFIGVNLVVARLLFAEKYRRGANIKLRRTT